MAEFINTRLDRYEIRERIGAGGMARVFKAWDTTLERPVAIKILHEHLAEDLNFKERFEREAKIVAGFNHPNIVQVYDFNTVERDGFPLYYMVMSYIPGQTLKEVIETLAAKSEQMGYTRALDIMLDLTDALGYAHKRGMAHRDVKPGNVIINESGKAILTDFGIARLVASTRLTMEGVSTGTPAYMSPEQASGQPGDTRSDLYALAVILFELLAGRLPFEDEGGLSLLLKHVNSPVPTLSEFLPDGNWQLDAIIYKALAKNPDDRYQSAEEFADDLQAALTGETTIHFRPGATPPLTLRVPTSPGMKTAPITPAQTAEAVITQLQQTNRTRDLAIFALVICVIVISVIALFALTRTTEPEATKQPAAPITAEAARAASSLFFTSNFDSGEQNLDGWAVGELGVLTAQITPDGFYRLRNERSGTAATTLFNPKMIYGDATITMTGMLETDSNDASAFGIVFRYQDNDNYNVFAVDGMGRFSIWVRKDGEWAELRDAAERWTKNEVIKPRGNVNTLTVDVVNEYVTGVVNDEQVFQITERTFRDGKIGIYLAAHRQGIASALIDSYRTDPAAPPSMTGE